VHNFVGFVLFIAGDPEEPATLISTLLLQTHARQLYSLTLTHFASFWWTSTKNVWNANSAMLLRASSVFGPWSRETQAQQRRRSIQIVVFCSLFMSHLNHFHHEISQLYYILQALLKTRSYHGEIILLQVPKYFIYPKSQICITRLLKIILNAQLIAT